MQDPSHVIYHGNCYDGFTAAWAAWRKLGSSAAYLPASYGTPPPELPKDARVLIADFSYSRPVMEDLLRRVASVAVLDHHKTSKEALEGFPGATFDMSKSGAMLAWEYFHPGAEPPPLVRYVQDRDLWRNELEFSREISAYLHSFEMNFKVWDTLAAKLEVHPYGAAIEGEAILRMIRQKVDLICRDAYFKTIDGHKVPVVNATAFTSEVGERLLQLFPSAPFSGFFYDKKGTKCWGLRSRGDFDVSAVAKKFGGGGHPAAAGFTEEASST